MHPMVALSPSFARHALWSLMVLVTVGCGADDDRPTAPATEAQATSAAAPSVEYDLHEWGLVSAVVGAGDVWVHTQGGAERTRRVLHGGGGGASPGLGDPLFHTGIGKPVLYVHLPEGRSAASFRLAVRLRGGRMLEHWPPGELTDDAQQLTWQVEATRGPCRGEYPARDSEACHTADGYCELAEVGAYETAEAACVRVGEQRAGVLFYRGEGPAVLPVRVDADDAGALSVRLRDEAAPPGVLLRVERSAHDRRATRVARFAPPASGSALAVPAWDSAAPLPLDAAAGEAVLAEQLSALGMTGAERDAFLNAWRDDLFGPAPVNADIADGGHGVLGDLGLAGAPPGTLAPVAHALLYFLPAEAAQEQLPLQYEPPPRQLRRALLVRVNLQPSPLAGVADQVLHGGEGTDVASLGPTPLRSDRAGAVLRLDSSRTTATGALPVEVVVRVLRRRAGPLARCAGMESAEGVLRLRLAVHAGAVRSATARAEPGSTFSAAARRCAESSARGWAFPTVPGAVAIDAYFLASPAPAAAPSGR